MSLRTSFSALVPENIKNIPLLKDAMDIFLTNLEENSSISVDIQNSFNVNVDLNASNTSQKPNTILRQTLLQVYLESIYAVIKTAQSNEELKKRLIATDRANSLLFTSSPEKIIGLENFMVGKHFNQSKGTISSINQAHYLANMLETGVDAKISPPNIKQPRRFDLIIESVITSIVYANIVEPLSHPVGFTYHYTQLVELIMEDFYGFHTEYTVNAIEVRGSDGTFHIFTQLVGTAAQNVVSVDFLTRTNFLTGSLFTQREITDLVTVYDGKVLNFVTENITPNGRSVEIQFVDGTAIVQNPGTNASLNIIYVNYTTWVSTGLGVINGFSSSNTNGQYSLYTDYTTQTIYDYFDEIFFSTSSTLTNSNDLTGSPGGNTYTDSNGNQILNEGSDNIIMTSTSYANETLTHSFTGNYIISGNSYFTTTDTSGGFYVVCGV